MKRGRLPLTALRSFEVAGRLESFTLAAQELFISQAAVSRQIRELETSLGEALFERRHRSVRLTASGARLQAILTLSFDQIDECLEEIRGRSTAAAVTISAEPSFAACWLVPRLPEFRERHPEIEVTIDLIHASPSSAVVRPKSPSATARSPPPGRGPRARISPMSG